MDAKTEHIVRAGWAMFARYGYAKTTMSDIATEAGVARQTVYNAFASKEDILRAVVRVAGEESLTSVQA
ncbi:MAG: helix-turn-helix domain-containing protein, partial [Pseudomonadota bacterium]